MDVVYPKKTFVWHYFRDNILHTGGRSSTWDKVSDRLQEARQKSLPKRFRQQHAWCDFSRFSKQFHASLCDRSSQFYCKVIQGVGLGIFARRKIEKGLNRTLHGYLRKLSHENVLRLDEMGETCIIQFKRSLLCKRKRNPKKRRKRSQRVDWFFMDGPASLLNHTCKGENAEFCFDERGSDGEFYVEILKQIEIGDQVLVNYGEEFWKDSTSKEMCCCEHCQK